MFIIILTGLTILLVTIYLILKKKTIDSKHFFSNRGISFFDVSTVGKFNKYRLPFSDVDLDQVVYNHFKKLGQPYGGHIQFMSPVFFPLDLEIIKKIMVKDFDHFTQRRVTVPPKTEPYLSRAVITLKGKDWHDVRSILSPTFSTGKIRRMFEFFNASGQNLSTYLKNKMERDGNVLDFQDAFGRYTMDVIASVAFGLQTDNFEDFSIFRQMAKKLQSFSIKRFLKIGLVFALPSVASLVGLGISEPESTQFFTSVAKQAIEERKGGKVKRNDFIQLMVEAQAGQLKDDDEGDENDGKLARVNGQDRNKVLDDNTMIGQCLIFFSAGSDTLESVLSFAAYLLATHPDVQEKLADEVMKTMKEHKDHLTYETTHSMEYLDMILSETLRLYPPAFSTERHCTKEYRIPDTNIVIPRGTRVVIPIRCIQRDDQYYADSEKFNPDNFNAENKAKRSPYAFMPFGLGPRNCIAMRFAITEAKSALAHLIYNFKLETCDKTQIPIQLNKRHFLSKPEKGVHLKFTSRILL